MKTNIYRWVFEIPLEEVQTLKNERQDITASYCCALCGKPMDEGGAKYQIHLLTNGNIVSTDQEFDSREDQGFFPIGNECKNKIPNNFYFKTETVL